MIKTFNNNKIKIKCNSITIINQETKDKWLLENQINDLIKKINKIFK